MPTTPARAALTKLARREERARCTFSWHWLLKSSPTSFDRETVGPSWILSDGEARWKMAQCRSCGSTLALELPREARP